MKWTQKVNKQKTPSRKKVRLVVMNLNYGMFIVKVTCLTFNFVSHLWDLCLLQHFWTQSRYWFKKIDGHILHDLLQCFILVPTKLKEYVSLLTWILQLYRVFFYNKNSRMVSGWVMWAFLKNFNSWVQRGVIHVNLDANFEYFMTPMTR